jgi:acyl-coenzyme A synthetase/AMP-(fatty) acid ligase
MSIVLDQPDPGVLTRLPLLASADPTRALVWHEGRAIVVGEYLAAVAALAPALPPRGLPVNLCEDRYHFLVAFGAALALGQSVLLPSSRAPQVVREVLEAHAGAYCVDDAQVAAACGHAASVPPAAITLPADHVAVLGFTSGSTGRPQRHPKRWDAFGMTTRLNAERIRAEVGVEAARPWILATVPPQHMYGMETSVLLPLIGDMGVHAARPLLPADVAAALHELPAPRVLVSTPVHLRALLESAVELPPLAVVLSATAPLERALAAAFETRHATRVLELFGSTETCVIATRRTAREDAWRLYNGVTLSPMPDGTRVEAPWFAAPTVLQDVIELLPERRFALRGRNVDLLEIAGKRASLAELTRRLLAVPGVRDGVVFQPDACTGAVRRVAALAVAPGLRAAAIVDALRHAVDPAFLPRPLVLVDQLPRNDVGKLPRERLLDALAAAGGGEAIGSRH